MRTIDADALLKKIEEDCDFYLVGDDENSKAVGGVLLGVKEQINAMPTVELQRMKGRWETDMYGAMDDGEYLVTRCNVCGTVYEYGHDDRYCGFCGAEMEAQNETS